MGWQPGRDGGTGSGPGRDPVPGGRERRVLDARLAEFAGDGSKGAPVPSGRLALVADELSGPERRCPGATDNELVGLLRAWAAIESWAAGAKLGAIRELMRREYVPVSGGRHGDLPDEWTPSLRYELAAALACSTQSAETTAWLAWELQARLSGIGALLDDGTLTFGKARAIVETFRYLSDGDAAMAEALILAQVAGKTYTQVLRLAEQAALTVDPELAERRREQAQKKDARVIFLREQSGTAALAGRDLPPDEALTAMASVNARAGEYKASGAFGDTPMDVLRAQAYLDLLNGTPAEGRIARTEPQDDVAEAAAGLAWAESRAARARARAGASHGTGTDSRSGPDAGSEDDAYADAGTEADTGARPQPDAPEGAGTSPAPTAGPADVRDSRECSGDVQADPRHCTCGECDGSCLPDHARGHCGNDDDDEPDDGGSPDDGGGGGGGGGPGSDSPGSDGPGSDGPGSGGPDPRHGVPPTDPARQRRPADLIVPLLTLLGLAERPGEIQGFGLLDPALARELAAAAIASPRTEVCVTVTRPEGYAVGHGCARLDRDSRETRAATSDGYSLYRALRLLPRRISRPPELDHPGHCSLRPRRGGRPFRLVDVHLHLTRQPRPLGSAGRLRHLETHASR